MYAEQSPEEVGLMIHNSDIEVKSEFNYSSEIDGKDEVGAKCQCTACICKANGIDPFSTDYTFANNKVKLEEASLTKTQSDKQDILSHDNPSNISSTDSYDYKEKIDISETEVGFSDVTLVDQQVLSSELGNKKQLKINLPDQRTDQEVILRDLTIPLVDVRHDIHYSNQGLNSDKRSNGNGDLITSNLAETVGPRNSNTTKFKNKKKFCTTKKETKYNLRRSRNNIDIKRHNCSSCQKSFASRRNIRRFHNERKRMKESQRSPIVQANSEENLVSRKYKYVEKAVAMASSTSTPLKLSKRKSLSTFSCLHLSKKKLSDLFEIHAGELITENDSNVANDTQPKSCLLHACNAFSFQQIEFLNSLITEKWGSGITSTLIFKIYLPRLCSNIFMAEHNMTKHEAVHYFNSLNGPHEDVETDSVVEEELANNNHHKATDKKLIEENLPSSIKGLVHDELPVDKGLDKTFTNTTTKNLAVDINPKVLATKQTTNKNIKRSKHSKTKKHYCLFCEKIVSSLARHLQRHHMLEEQVTKAFSYEKRSSERLNILETIRKQGDMIYNLTASPSQLLSVRNSSKRTLTTYMPCPHCKGYYSKKNLHGHVRLQHKNKEKKMIPGNILGRSLIMNERHVHPELCDELKTVLLPSLRNKKILKFALTDDLAVKYGNTLVNTFYKLSTRHSKMIMAKIRQMANFFFIIQSLEPTIQSLVEIFRPKFHDIVIKGIRIFSGMKDGYYKHPNNAISMRILLGKLCKFVRRESIKREDRVSKLHCDEFEILLRSQQNDDVTKAVAETRGCGTEIKRGWTTLQKRRIRNEFITYYYGTANTKYPPLSEYDRLIMTFPELRGKSSSKIRSFLQHEFKLIEDGKRSRPKPNVPI